MTFRIFLPVAAIAAVLAVHQIVPTIYPEDYEAVVYPAFLKLCLGLAGVFTVLAFFVRTFRGKWEHLSWLIVAIFVLIEILDIATLKTGHLRLPYVPSPDKILNTAVTQYNVLVEGFLASMRLLFTGLFFGILSGLISGILMGWSKHCNYWFSPALKIIGPMPSAPWWWRRCWE